MKIFKINPSCRDDKLAAKLFQILPNVVDDQEVITKRISSMVERATLTEKAVSNLARVNHQLNEVEVVPVTTITFSRIGISLTMLRKDRQMEMI